MKRTSVDDSRMPATMPRSIDRGTMQAKARAARNAVLAFFFQAEDGIRDLTVTGVQTCALPILRRVSRRADAEGSHGCDRAGLSFVRRAPAHGCAASGRRQRETVFALFVLLARV